MAIIIPSKKIYDISHSIVNKNSISSIEYQVASLRQTQKWQDVLSKVYDSSLPQLPYLPPVLSGMSQKLSTKGWYGTSRSLTIDGTEYGIIGNIKPLYLQIDNLFAKTQIDDYNFVDISNLETNPIYISAKTTFIKRQRVGVVIPQYDGNAWDWKLAIVQDYETPHDANLDIQPEQYVTDLPSPHSVSDESIPLEGWVTAKQGEEIKLREQWQYSEPESSTHQYIHNGETIKANLSLVKMEGSNETMGFALNLNVLCGAMIIEGGGVFEGGGLIVNVTEYHPSSINITINGNVHTLSVEQETYVENYNTAEEGEKLSITDNLLGQNKTFISNQAQNVLLEYANGKETAKILCSIGEYYDENSDLAISTKTADKMIFEHYDKVVPMIRNGYGQDEAMSYNADGTAKVFEVVGVRVYSDGAVWQELTLREASGGVDIPSAEKLAIPQIVLSQDLLTIHDNSGKAEKFEILVDGSTRAVIPSSQTTYDLSTLNLDYGSYKITVIAIATGYINSSQSNAVSYTIVDPNIQTLPTPYLTLEGDTLYIYGDIASAEKFDVWVNGTVRTTTTSTTVNLSSLNLGVGTFTIFVVARAKGYNDSAQSESVTYIVEKKTLLLAGKYVFNQNPDLSQTINQPLNTRIIVGSTTYTITNISIGVGGIAYTTVEGNRIVVYDGSTWASDNLRNIELLENAEVTTSFYEWFFQNVAKQKITFSIGEKSYTADAGMSWYQWCNSSYNVDKWLVKANTATEQVYRYTSSTTIEAVYDANVKVSAIDKIGQGTVYVTREEFSQESSSAEILEYVDENFAKKEEVGSLEQWVKDQEYTNDTEVREIISTEVAQKIENKDLVNEEQVNSIVGEAIKSIKIEQYVTEAAFKQTLSGYTNTQDMRSEISKSVGELSASVSQTTQSLQNQIDGAISTWYYEGVPTTSNAPAVNWTTDAEKQKHDGDIYYDQITGYAYRWQRSTTGYYWQKISDTDINKALEEAEKAKNIQIGGRNLAYYTGESDSIITHLGLIINSGSNPLSHRWNVTKNDAYFGTKIVSSIFEAGETYTISFFLRKTAGTLSNIGGHISAFAQQRLSVDGKETSALYGNGVSISNDTSIHYIVFTGKYNGGSEDNNFYIQPNRGIATSVTYDLWNIKVERGEKATDFTPAWEEYYTSVQTNAQIEATASQIRLSVDGLTDRLNEDYYTKSQIDITSTEIRQEVSAIQVGARNILSKDLMGNMRKSIVSNDSVSGFGYICPAEIKNVDWYIFGESADLNLKPNTDYTVSFTTWLDTTETNARQKVTWDLWPDNLPQEFFEATPIPTRHSWTISSPEEEMLDAIFRIFAYEADSEGYFAKYAIYVTDIKIEEGNKATDWTPAVQDMASVDFVKGSLALEIVTENGETFSQLTADAGYMKFGANKKLVIDSPQFTLDKNGNAIFNGTLSAPKGNLGGWIVDENEISTGYKSTATATRVVKLQPAKSADTYVISVSDGYGGYPFYLRADGKMHASDISLGVGLLGSTDVVRISTEDMSGTIGVEQRSDWRLSVGSKFGVTKEGKLFATDGNFTGTVHATDGAFGDLEIDSEGMSIINEYGSLKLQYKQDTFPQLSVYRNNVNNQPYGSTYGAEGVTVRKSKGHNFSDGWFYLFDGETRYSLYLDHSTNTVKFNKRTV